MQVYKSFFINTRSETRENWIKENPILLAGEIGFEQDKGLYKIGDGITRYNNLNYKSAYKLQINQGIARLLIEDKKYVTNDINNAFSYSQNGSIVKAGFSVKANITKDKPNLTDDIMISLDGAPNCSVPYILINNVVINGLETSPDNICMEFVKDTSILKFKLTYKYKRDEEREYDDYREFMKTLEVQDIHGGEFYVRGSIIYISDPTIQREFPGLYFEHPDIEYNRNLTFIAKAHNDEECLTMFNVESTIDTDLDTIQSYNDDIILKFTSDLLVPKYQNKWLGGSFFIKGIKHFDPVLEYTEDGFKLLQSFQTSLTDKSENFDYVKYSDIRSNLIRISGILYYAI